MNINQKKLLITAACIYVIMLVFPPFIISDGGFISNAGYSFIFTGSTTKTVNTALLFLEWLYITSIGFIGWFLLKDKN